MKKIVYILAICCLFFIVGADIPKVKQQDTIQDLTEEELAVQDSVSIDDLDPVFYEAVEEGTENEDSDKTSWIFYVLAGVIIVGGGFFFLSRSRKK